MCKDIQSPAVQGIGRDAQGVILGELVASPLRIKPVVPKRAGMGKQTYARFTPFARGKIVGKAEEKVPLRKIQKPVFKKDGTRASIRAHRIKA